VAQLPFPGGQVRAGDSRSRSHALVPGTPAANAARAAGNREPGTGNLTMVNRETAAKAAQIDPRRDDHTPAPGARTSVLAVENARQAENLLDARWVDGSFGTGTVSAYARYQSSPGYTGPAANGLPGGTSLTRLGQGRSTVTHVATPGAWRTRDGGVVNARTGRPLAEAERRFGRAPVPSQGSYNPGATPTSGGTHDGGVADISVQA
jgi:hypothetical protein